MTRYAIITSRFNPSITDRLYEGAHKTLLENGVKQDHIHAFFVPGAFEIPVMAKKILTTLNVDAVICLGAVIRGETTHYDYICQEVSRGIAQLALEYSTPLIFGVLTCENFLQAEDRISKGEEAALSALEMVKVLDTL